MDQTIVALFENRADAEAAVQKLTTAGVARSSIGITSGKGERYMKSATSSYDYRRDEGGFWASMKDLFMPEEDRYAYAEGLSRGGTVVTAKIDAAHAVMAEEVLESAGGSLDLEQEEAGWRSSGWSGYSATGTTAAAGAAGLAATTAARTGTAALGSGQDETISVYEESLKVGKRVVDRGRIRLRSYVVETPVSEQVSLRDETVEIERHPVDRAVTAGEATAFAGGERVIEVEAHGEEAVVSKDLRVKEEIGLRKTAEQRTETITDKVRHTEVEIEDSRVAATKPAAEIKPGTRKPL